MVFAEIDPDYRHDFLQIDKYIDQIVPTEAGKPKRTKFIAIQGAGMSTFCLESTSPQPWVVLLWQPYDKEHESGYCVLSGTGTNAGYRPLMDEPSRICEFITDPQQPKSAPKMLFNQIDFDIDDFLTGQTGSFHKSPIPNVTLTN